MATLIPSRVRVWLCPGTGVNVWLSTVTVATSTLPLMDGVPFEQLTLEDGRAAAEDGCIATRRRSRGAARPEARQRRREHDGQTRSERVYRHGGTSLLTWMTSPTPEAPAAEGFRRRGLR